MFDHFHNFKNQNAVTFKILNVAVVLQRGGSCVVHAAAAARARVTRACRARCGRSAPDNKEYVKEHLILLRKHGSILFPLDELGTCVWKQ